MIFSAIIIIPKKPKRLYMKADGFATAMQNTKASEEKKINVSILMGKSDDLMRAINEAENRLQ